MGDNFLIHGGFHPQLLILLLGEDPKVTATRTLDFPLLYTFIGIIKKSVLFPIYPLTAIGTFHFIPLSIIRIIAIVKAIDTAIQIGTTT